jgi:hypothetical protein
MRGEIVDSAQAQQGFAESAGRAILRWVSNNAAFTPEFINRFDPLIFAAYNVQPFSRQDASRARCCETIGCYAARPFTGSTHHRSRRHRVANFRRAEPLRRDGAVRAVACRRRAASRKVVLHLLRHSFGALDPVADVAL